MTGPYIRTGEPTMSLPRGATCGDCAHFAKCRVFVGREGKETECDWDPSAFAWPGPTPGPKKGT